MNHSEEQGHLPLSDYERLSLNQRRKLAKKSGMSLKEWEARMDALYEKSGLSAVGVKTKAKRTECRCQGAQHALITNCLGCGNLVCQRQGVGACFICGNFVESKEQQQRNLFSGLIEMPLFDGKDVYDRHKLDKPSAIELEEYEAAKCRVERLLSYEANAIQRTKIVDMESDFDYEAAIDDPWLNVEEKALLVRQLAKKQEQEELLQTQRNMVTLDLSGKRVLQVDIDEQRKLLEPLNSVQDTLSKYKQQRQKTISNLGTGVYQNKTLKLKPKYVSSSAHVAKKSLPEGVAVASTTSDRNNFLEEPQQPSSGSLTDSNWVANLRKSFKRRTVIQDNWDDDFIEV